MADDQPKGALEGVVNSTATIFLARIVIPILITVIGAFGTLILTDLRDGQKAAASKIEDIRQSFWNAQGSLAKNQNEMSVKIGILGEKVDSLARRVDRLDSIPAQHPGP